MYLLGCIHLLLLALVLTTANGQECAKEASVDERAALIDLYHSTGGDGWASPWPINDTSISYCCWEGVVCFLDGFAITLTLDAVPGLMGTLPDAIGRLIHLQVIVITNNPLLVGSIPDSIDNLTQLTLLELFENNLSGTIPDVFAPPLGGIDVHNNHLQGPFPVSLASILGVVIDLSVNNLSGTLPPNLFEKSTYAISVSHNSFSGSIPSLVLASIPDVIFSAEFSHNLFSGELFPNMDMSSLVNFTFLQVQSNLLSGTLPNFSGSNLVFIDLSDNYFSGTISPLSFQSMSGLESLNLAHNNLSGPLPDLGFIPSIMSFNASHNVFVGPFPNASQLWVIQDLDLSYNFFSGTLPPYLGLLQSLTNVILNNNFFYGTIPPYVGGRFLTMLDFSYNNFSGTIPETVLGSFNSVSLTYLNMRYNMLNGSLPSFCADMANLEYLDLSMNRFTGTIGSTLDRLAAPSVTLNLSHCALSGPIPTELSSVDFVSLDLSYNQLYGSLPFFLETPPSFLDQENGTLALQCNRFCAPREEWWCTKPNRWHVSCERCDGEIDPCTTPSSYTVWIVAMCIGLVIIIALVICVWVQRWKRFSALNTAESLFLTGVHIGRVIGAGAHGQVFHGEWQGVAVALKTIAGRKIDWEALRSEAAIMKSLVHPNIVTFLGLYEDKEDNNRLYIVTEYMPGGSLDKLLHQARSDHQYTMQHRVQMCRDVAAGMVQLEEKSIVHCDLASRNLLVGPNYAIRVADFGLSMSQLNASPSRSGSGGGSGGGNGGSGGAISPHLPIRWCAPEAIIKGQFTVKSDVWSFGVVMWEVLHLAALPYHGMTNQECFKWIMASTDNRLQFGEFVPEEISTIAQRCWDLDPARRPSFRSLVGQLDAYLNKSYHDSIQNAIELAHTDQPPHRTDLELNLFAADDQPDDENAPFVGNIYDTNIENR